MLQGAFDLLMLRHRDKVGSQHQDARELWHFGLRGSRGTSVNIRKQLIHADPHIGHEGLTAESRPDQKAVRTSQI